MLVKIKTPENKWKLIDNAEEVEYSDNSRRVNTEEELLNLVNSANCDEEIVVLDGPLPKKVRSFSFSRYERTFFVVFSTVTYICDDSGKTLESLKVER